MRISAAGLRSGFPTTRFAAPSTTRRESHLGLHRRLGPQMYAVSEQTARVPLLGALRAAARGQSIDGGMTMDAQPVAKRRTIILRRSDSVTWARASSDGSIYRPRSRSAAPWRG
jgi:hypothetical protein